MVVPDMIERKDGSVIIVSSIGGLKGSTILGAYAISKAADMQLARNLAREYGKFNVRVNCIAPGLIKTDFAKALWDNPENLKASTARSPLLRIGIPDEIAGAAVFLGSAAGNFMTGQTMVIDGGATISWSLTSRRSGRGRRTAAARTRNLGMGVPTAPAPCGISGLAHRQSTCAGHAPE